MPHKKMSLLSSCLCC